jgi:hypothetical protein
MTPHPTPWTMETVTAGLARFYHEIAGVGLVFPSAVRPLERLSQPSTPPPWGSVDTPTVQGPTL